MPITPSPAVLRAGDILAHMIEHPEDAFTVSELARTVDIPRATCDAILQALEQNRLVARRGEDRSFELGPMSIALGDAARIANPSLRAATAEAESLARAIGGCVVVCVYDADMARIAEVHDFGPLFAIRARVGQAIPIVPPFGAVFVAWSPEEADAWIDAGSETLADQERERYRHALGEVRRRGYSVAIAQPRDAETPGAIDALLRPDDGDVERSRSDAIRQMAHSDYLPDNLEEGESIRLAQISAPIFERDGRVRTSLMMAGPDHDVSIGEIHSFADRLVRAARAATRNAGGREPT